MEKDLKDILLKDLCARLPYKVEALFFDVEKNYISIIEGIDIYKFIKDSSGMESEISDVKPYLFPLSSMTEEQRKEYNSLRSIGVDECGDITYFDTFESVDWCNKNHLDYRGLIEKGLAIDATELNIY